MKFIKPNRFDSSDLIEDLFERFEKFDSHLNGNYQWVQDCQDEAKMRLRGNGGLVPITPKGRPRTRNYMRTRALKLELANQTRSSPKAAKVLVLINKSVTYNATPRYLNRSISSKKATKHGTKVVKINPGKNGDKAGPKNRLSSVKMNLFKSPVARKAKIKNEGAEKDDVESKKMRKKLTAQKPQPTKTATEAKEDKNPVKRGRPVALSRQLKGNLEKLAENLLKSPEPVNKKVASKTTRMPKVDEKIVEETSKKPIKTKNDIHIVTGPPREVVMDKIVVVNDKESIDASRSAEASELPELCDKSLQVSMTAMKSMKKVTCSPLNPYVKLVDIYTGPPDVVDILSHKVQTTTPRVAAMVTNDASSSTPLNKNSSTAEKGQKIFFSTPNENVLQSKSLKNWRPVVMLERLDLTRISIDGFPPGISMDNSEIFCEIDAPPLPPTTAATAISTVTAARKSSAESDHRNMINKDQHQGCNAISTNDPKTTSTIATTTVVTLLAAAAISVVPSVVNINTAATSESVHSTAAGNRNPITANQDVGCPNNTNTFSLQNLPACVGNTLHNSVTKFGHTSNSIINNNNNNNTNPPLLSKDPNSVASSSKSCKTNTPAANKSNNIQSPSSTSSTKSTHTTATTSKKNIANNSNDIIIINDNSTLVEEVSSYDMTPVRKNKVYLLSTETDYNIRDLESDDSSDDECRPRKVVPQWARGERLRRAIYDQSSVPLKEVSSWFNGEDNHDLRDLTKIFVRSKRGKRLNKRTSSAHWDGPPLKKHYP